MRAVIPVPDTPALDLVPNNAALHGLSLGALMTTFMGWLPAILAIIPAAYYLLLIFESKTVQSLLERRRLRRAARRAARAEAAATVAHAKLDATKQVAEAKVDADKAVVAAEVEIKKI